MMQKLWQKKPKLSYSKEVIDIVQFGSSIQSENPNDLDVALIFQKIPLKEQLNQAQEIKKQLQSLSEVPIHVSSFDFYSLFDKGNFAKEGILFYGRSIISGKYFAETLGFTPRIHISYSLKSLKKKDKIRFNYLLNGRGGKYGLLREYNGRIISPGLIEIMPELEKIFIEEMKKITSEIKVKKVLF